MGDLLGSPRVAPLFCFCRDAKLSFFFLWLLRRGSLVCAGVGVGAAPQYVVKYIWRAKPDGCDHTSTNAPDPIRTPQLSVLGREQY